jgi:uroporphyrin-3 C-methyltransferase
VFALGGAAGWYYQQTQLREAALLERLAYLEDTAAAMNVPAPEPEGYATEQALASVASEARQLDSRTLELDNRTRQLEALLKDLQDRPAPEAVSAAPAIDTEALTRDWESRLSDALARVEAINRRQEQQLETLSGEVGVLAQQPQVNIDRDAWQLAEVEYLLRLANQRMIMAGDTETAGALLSSADKILQELDDIAMLDVRRALAEDLAAIQAVPRLDIEGMYLKLAALIGQADALVIFELPDTLESVEPVAPETWQERLMAGWQHALETLSSYIVIRRRDTSAEALMDPQWERMVRQNLRMLLEESQVALLSGNQLLFEESLQRTLYWVEEFFISDEAAARALHADLTALMEKAIAVKLPDISGSMLAFDRAMARKLALSEANN